MINLITKALITPIFISINTKLSIWAHNNSTILAAIAGDGKVTSITRRVIMWMSRGKITSSFLLHMMVILFFGFTAISTLLKCIGVC